MGFAYYANYLRWFEIGRAEMLRSLGTSYREVEAQGIWLPVLEAWCRYLEPARYDDALAVETGVAEFARASVRFGYRIRRDADDTTIAYGTTLHCFLSPDGRPSRPPEFLTGLLVSAPRVSGTLEPLLRAPR